MAVTASNSRSPVDPTAQGDRTANSMPDLSDVTACLVGEASAWFELERGEHDFTIRPRRPLPRRCCIRPAALFEQDRGFLDVNTVMGRLVFAAGTTQEQRYRPFSCDSRRRLVEVFFPVEAMPHDDWPASVSRWTNFQAIAKRLTAVAGVPWSGLSSWEIDALVRFMPWSEPVEGCLLHALTGWTHALGRCVVEIGSFRGRSLFMLALALRAAGSDSLLFSIDPHADEPVNAELVRLSLRQIGEEHRLVQMKCRSDEAWRLLRPGSASLVFVDGDHSYNQVVADFGTYRGLLAEGGCMVFHDYGYGLHNGRPEADPEVRPAIDETVFRASGFRPLLLAHTQMAFLKSSEEVFQGD